MKSIIIAIVMFLALPAAVQAQTAGGEENLPIYYVVERDLSLQTKPEGEGADYVDLKFREPIYLVRQINGWCEVKTRDGARGFVPTRSISNVWLRIEKSTQTLYVYEGEDLVRKVPVDLGFNAFADKEKQGSTAEKDHWRTPEGNFFVVEKNARSQYYKAFVLNYPTKNHAERGLKAGLISEAEYERIVTAEEASQRPPMNTALGGMIEIHGKGTGARSNWTHGCVAISNTMMDTLWDDVPVGTPVLIER